MTTTTTNILEKDFTAAKQLIDRSHNILLTMHERMDGDDGGSVLAMAYHLEKIGKQVTCAIKHGVPPNLKFLPGSEKIADDIANNNFDLLITFGCANKQRCGSETILKLPCPVVNFDHHPDNAFFGQVNVVDRQKSSVAELVYDFFLYHNWPITKEVATALLTGMFTDTGSFMHSNTASSTLRAAAELMRKGANLHNIVNLTQKNKNPKILKAWGHAMQNLHYDSEHKIIYALFSQADSEELGELPPAAFEGLVETINTIPGAQFALFLKQDGSMVKGSLRSEKLHNVDVAKIAKAFGGGGHKQAAGFSVVGQLTKDQHGKWKII